MGYALVNKDFRKEFSLIMAHAQMTNTQFQLCPRRFYVATVVTEHLQIRAAAMRDRLATSMAQLDTVLRQAHHAYVRIVEKMIRSRCSPMASL